MHKSAMILLASALCSLVSAHSQNPAPLPLAPPTGSLLQHAPELSQWKIQFSYPAATKHSDKVASRQASSSVTTKTRHLIHERTRSNGQEFERWYIAAAQYSKVSGTPIWLENGPGKLADGTPSDPNYSPLPASGFRDLDWITPTSYFGTTQYEGRDCLVFVPPDTGFTGVRTSTPEAAVLDAQLTIAYIDAQTRLPVRVRIGGEERRYQFDSPPAQMQVLPPDIADQIKKADEARTRLQQPPPRPY